MTALREISQRAMLALAECAVLMQSDHLDDLINELHAELENPDETDTLRLMLQGSRSLCTRAEERADKWEAIAKGEPYDNTWDTE
jgi:hypothetical protein